MTLDQNPNNRIASAGLHLCDGCGLRQRKCDIGSVQEEGAVEQETRHEDRKDHCYPDGNGVIHPFIFGADEHWVNEFAASA
jgi:hypothetical protein